MLFLWIRNHLRELFIVLCAILALLYIPGVVRLHDPTAGELDGSVFQILSYAGLLFFGVLTGFWVATSAFFPTIGKHIDGKFKSDWTALPPVHRAWLTLAFLFMLTVLASVCLLASHLL